MLWPISVADHDSKSWWVKRILRWGVNSMKVIAYIASETSCPSHLESPDVISISADLGSRWSTIISNWAGMEKVFSSNTTEGLITSSIGDRSNWPTVLCVPHLSVAVSTREVDFAVDDTQVLHMPAKFEF